jgi:hypothetical protein
MPPLPVVTDALQVTVHGTSASSEILENVFGIVFTGTLTQAYADAVSDYFATAYTELQGGTADDVSYNSVTVTDLRTVDGPQFESTSSWPIVGTDSGDMLPLQTAGLISWYTARRGRSFRGRTYLGGFCENFSSGAHIDSTLHTAIAAFADDLLSTSNYLGIISRYESGVLRDPGIITPITSRVVHDLWATQRRRAPR